MITTQIPGFTIRKASAQDAELVLFFIQELAKYEKLLDQCVATKEALTQHLFSDQPCAEVYLAYELDEPVGFCLFFTNFSTFLAQPGIYLEDIYIRTECRNQGYGKVLLSFIAKLAVDRGCGRFEWSVLDWNEPSIAFYRKIGAVGMEEWTSQRLSGDALHQLASEF
jgi:GNAT superfamily N-acetyltransferase